MQTELNKVVSALVEFYARETHLLEKDLGERTLTHRLDVPSRKLLFEMHGETVCDGRLSHLLEKDLGERTLTHRLAVHLEKQFAGWDVDCDYNRLGERTLRLPHGTIVSTDDHLGKSVYPDIVVHRRAVPDNLLAIEVR